jgi:hypothetical protein
MIAWICEEVEFMGEISNFYLVSTFFNHFTEKMKKEIYRFEIILTIKDY